MFYINEDNSIYATRGDIVFFAVTAEDQGKPYEFQAGDVLRVKIFTKKAAENVVLEKDFPVVESTEKVEIFLDEEDTKIGEVISKPTDYWYEVELNPLTNPQTIIGYDDDGAKVFKLFPEGANIPVYVPDEEDIPFVDSELDLTSPRPVANQAVARKIVSLNADLDRSKADTQEFAERMKVALAEEQAKLNNIIALEEGSTTGDAELDDSRIGSDGYKFAVAGDNVRAAQKLARMSLYHGDFVLENVAGELTENSWVDINGTVHEGEGYNTLTANVIPGEVYYIYSLFGYDCPDAIVYDAEGNMLGCYNQSAVDMKSNYYTMPIVIPPEGVTMKVCSFGNPDAKRVVGKEFTSRTSTEQAQKVLDALMTGNTPIDGEAVEGEITEGGYLPKPTTIGVISGTSASKYFVGSYQVTPGDILHIVGSANYGNTVYTFARGESVIQTMNAPKFVSLDKCVIVPPSADTLLVASELGSVPSVYHVVGTKGGNGMWSHLKWVCLGDSLTEENTRTTKHYHSYVKDKTGIQVVNMGVSGSGYYKLKDTEKAFYQRALSIPSDADVVTIFGSGNDLSNITELGNPTDTDTNTICGCINKTIDNIYSVNPVVQLGIVSPTPWTGQTPNKPECAMYRYTEALKEICKLRGIPFLDLFRCSGFRPDDATYRSMVFSKDPEGVANHPDETGHKIISGHFYSFLQNLISTY